MVTAHPTPRASFDLAAACFGKEISTEIAKTLSKNPHAVHNLTYGSVISGPSAVIAQNLEKNLLNFVGNPEFSEHLRAHKEFIQLVPLPAKVFLEYRLKHILQVNKDVLTGRIQKQDAPDLLSKMSIRHARAFEGYNTALMNEDHIKTEKWCKAMDAALDREKYREITRGL